MKKLFLILSLIASTALAANITDDTLKIGKPGSSVNKKLKLGTTGQIQYNVGTSKLQFSHDGTNFKNVGSGGGGGGGGINLLTDNPDAESGVGNWTASGGTFTTTSTAANVYEGVNSFVFTPSAGAQTVTSDAYASTAAMEGNNGCSSVIYYKTAEATNKYIVNAMTGSTVLGTLTLEASSTYIPATVPFPCQTVGTTVKLQISAAASTPSSPIYWDAAFNGIGYNLSQVSQARFLGAVKITGCSAEWATSSTTLASFGTKTSCVYTTYGSALAPTTNLPAIRFASLPPGELLVYYEGGLQETVANKVAYFQFTDGTTTARELSEVYAPTGVGAGGTIQPGIKQSMSFPNGAGATTIELFGKVDSSGAGNIYGTTAQPGVISVYYYPTGQETAVRADASSVSWSGAITSCASGLTTTSGTFADPSNPGSCALTSSAPAKGIGVAISASSGVSVTPSRAGRYRVKVSGIFESTSTTNSYGVRLIDSTGIVIDTATAYQQQAGNRVPFTLTGFVDLVSTAAQIIKVQALTGAGTMTLGSNSSGQFFTWSIEAVDGGSTNMQIFKGLVTTSGSGQEHVERANLAVACTTGTCALASSSSGISSITWTATGTYTVAFAAGAFSATPTCTVTPKAFVSGVVPIIDTESASSVRVRIWTNTSGTTGNDGFNILCVGPK